MSPKSPGIDAPKRSFHDINLKKSFISLERRIFSLETASLLMVAAFIFGIFSVGMILTQPAPEDPNENPLPGYIAGYVRNETGAGISGAIVKIKEFGIEKATDSEGYYHFTAVSPGEYTVITEAKGYGTVLAKVSVDGSHPRMYSFTLPPLGKTSTHDWREPIPPPSFNSMNRFLAGVFTFGSISALLGAFSCWQKKHFKLSMWLATFGVLSYGFLAGSLLSGLAAFFMMGQKHAFKDTYLPNRDRTEERAVKVVQVRWCEACGEKILSDTAFVECDCGTNYHIKCAMGSKCVRCGQHFRE